MARILVVDDDVDLRELTHLVLTRAGHCVDVASDGREAVRRIDARSYAVVVLDVAMPYLSGLEVAALVTRGGTAHRPRIVMASAFGSDHDRQRALEAGADHYLVKPVPCQEVSDAVAAQVELFEQVDRDQPASSSSAIRSSSTSVSNGLTT